MDFLYKQGEVPVSDYIYDIETYPNIFTFAAIHAATGQRYFYELSPRRNDISELVNFMTCVSVAAGRLVGFNNVGFDYPIIHMIYQHSDTVTNLDIYNKAEAIINASDNARFAHLVWDSNRVVDQVDLYKIHHFDNRARAVGLKMIEVNMGMDNVEDLPFPPGTVLTYDQMETLVDYNWDDIWATYRFYRETLPMINFRQELSERYGTNYINHNDTKIGKDFLIMKLEESMPGCCYDTSSGRRQVRQTKRDRIALKDVMFNYIQFEQPEFQRIHRWFQDQSITETKGVFNDISCTIQDFQYDFGLGGIHGSVESSTIEADHGYVISDWDVASYYPNIAIANRARPAHLPEAFCDIYQSVYEERKKYGKGTPENAMYKLALNGVYGDSNNQYSPFYDPAYTMTITINGQLMLCMLAEQLIKIPHLEMIQINTDGLTVKCPRQYIDHMNAVCQWWQDATKLQLEESRYSRMFIRDVNNYIGEYEDGKLKRKGAYCYGDDLGWHQNHSSQVVAKAAEASLVRDEDVGEFIYNHARPQDFLINTKVPRSSKLALSIAGEDHIVPNIVRYVVTTDGHPLNKIMPSAGTPGEYKRANKLTDEYFNAVMAEIGPGVWDERIHTKNKSQYEAARRIGLEAGHLVTICNDIQQLQTVNIDYDYYINRALKLVEPLGGS